MKYDLERKSNRFAQRTLSAFSGSLFALLKKKPFEEITVNELCKTCNYPRATFYNYFEDIYDLLAYCWRLLAKEIHVDDYVKMQPDERLFVLFDRIYDFMTMQKKEISSILRFNGLDGEMIHSFQQYLGEQIFSIMKTCSCRDQYPVPYELVAKHYSNTILLIVEWGFLKGNCHSKESAIEYLKYLLNGV
ncbi:TetR/AcrR family transcriptional regulator [uncultured Dubosiella sp.]|uniref:TetR/AcrR family transcriptional regulator n=3 Tax=uncultured Dubosiella sp. TaxID=1937011 RepID=UPI00259708CB|nr:TetR/AcrR family transcriptional regulator [uncultured Dubosiella sp.]